MTKIMTVYAAFDRIKKTDLSLEHQCIISPLSLQDGRFKNILRN